jgi:hypothetical protein
MAINTCVENFSGVVLKALAASTSKCRPCDDPRLLIPTGIQDEIRLKNQLRRRWPDTRDSAVKAEANRLQRSVTSRLNEWRNDQWSGTFESLDPEDQSLEDDQAGDDSSYSVTPWSPPRELLSQILRKQKPLPTIWRLSFSR